MFDFNNQCSKCEEFKSSDEIVHCNCGSNLCLNCLDESCDFCPDCGKDLSNEADELRKKG